MKMKSNTSKSVRNIVLTALMAAPAAFLPSTLNALPSMASTNVTVASGTASSATNLAGTTLTITATDKTILNWTAFGSGTNLIAGGETVVFTLGSSSAAILNRINGSAATTINGSITSDGKVFILNPNGITIAPTTSGTDKIVTAGFYASTVQEPDGYFAANGTLSYIGSATTAITGTAADIKATGGDIYLVAKGVTLTGAGSFEGNLFVRSTDGGAVALEGTVKKISGSYGNLDVKAQGGNGAVTLAAGAAGLTVQNDLVVTTEGTGGIDASGNAAGLVVNGNATLTTTDANISQSAGSLTINGTDKVTTLTANGSRKVNVSGDFTIVKLRSKLAGSTIVDANDISIGTSNTNNTTLAITSTAGDIKAVTGQLLTTGTGALTLNSSAGKNVTVNSSGAVTIAAITGTTAASDVTLTATGNITLPALTAKNLSVQTTNGTIAGTGVITTVKATFDATKDINLTGKNVLGTLVLKNGAGDSTGINGIAVTNDGDLVIGDGTTATGATTITLDTTSGANRGITFGAAAADVVTFNGALTVNAVGTGTISTVSKNLTLAGVNTLGSTNSAVSIGVASSTTASFGQLNIAAGTGAVSVISTGDVNLGTIGLTGVGALSVDAAGNIGQSGVITTTTAGGNVTLKVAAGKNINIGTKNNSIAGTITVTKANDLTIKNTVDTTVVGTAVDGVASFIVGGNALTATGEYNVVGFTADGTVAGNKNISITDATGITIKNATYAGNVAGTDGTVSVTATTGNIVLDSGINIATLAALGSSFTATTGTITDNADGIQFYGALSLTAKSGITIDNASHSFGTVTLATTNNTDVIFNEAGTLKLGALSLGTGSLTATSASGDIITAAAIVGAKNVTLTANNGKIDAATAGANAVLTGNLTASAKNAILYTSAGALSLGDVLTTTGDLTVVTGGALTQATDKTINAYGASSFTTTGFDLTLANSGNRFGKLTLKAGAANNASVKEFTTLNLGEVLANNLTLVSEAGSIIDNVNSGKIVDSRGTATLTANGVGAEITLDAAANEFNKVALFSKTGNATIVDKNVNADALTLVVGSKLDVGSLSLKSAGAISQSGAVDVYGNASFEAAGITLNASDNRFGAIKVTSSANVYIVENTTINLAAGSTVTGAATTAEFTSFGNIVTSGTGGSNYANTLRLNATGDITITNAFYVNSGLTLNALGTKDVLALSKSGNLNNIAPTFLGTGANKGPNP